MTEKESYFEDLRELETDGLFLTDSVDMVNEEALANCWRISISPGIAKQVSTDDFLLLLSKVKANRQQQLDQSTLAINIIYYLWFDEMAGQLRLNFINSNHEKLPFRCEISFVNSEQEIIEDFLNSTYLDGIPWNELQAVDINAPELERDTNEKSANEEVYVLKMYKQVIFRTTGLK